MLKSYVFGALTSFEYEFRARAWELKRFNFYDISNVEGVLLQLEFKGFSLVRVLPAGKNWVLNESRNFFFENYEIKQEILPLFFGLHFGHFYISWVKLIEILLFVLLNLRRMSFVFIMSQLCVHFLCLKTANYKYNYSFDLFLSFEWDGFMDIRLAQNIRKFSTTVIGFFLLNMRTYGFSPGWRICDISSFTSNFVLNVSEKNVNDIEFIGPTDVYSNVPNLYDKVIKHKIVDTSSFYMNFIFSFCQTFTALYITGLKTNEITSEILYNYNVILNYFYFMFGRFKSSSVMSIVDPKKKYVSCLDKIFKSNNIFFCDNIFLFLLLTIGLFNVASHEMFYKNNSFRFIVNGGNVCFEKENFEKNYLQKITNFFVMNTGNNKATKVIANFLKVKFWGVVLPFWGEILKSGTFSFGLNGMVLINNGIENLIKVKDNFFIILRLIHILVFDNMSISFFETDFNRILYDVNMRIFF
jgi:hypothetical protein